MGKFRGCDGVELVWHNEDKLAGSDQIIRVFHSAVEFAFQHIETFVCSVEM